LADALRRRRPGQGDRTVTPASNRRGHLEIKCCTTGLGSVLRATNPRDSKSQIKPKAKAVIDNSLLLLVEKQAPPVFQ
jgi:hypothetical protein